MADQQSDGIATSAQMSDPALAVSRLVPVSAADGSRMRQRVHAWIVEHDDSKLFLVLYVGLAVVLSIWISLFWLVAVVAVHFGFELIRQARERSTTRQVVAEALWELKLDVALVLFALVLALYLEMILGVAGLSGAARVGAASRAAVRVAGWERALRGVLLSLDDVAQVVRATVMRRRREPAVSAAGRTATVPDARSAVATGSPWGSWAAPYPAGAWIALVLGAVCAGLITASPWLTPHSAATAVQTLAAELRPLP